MRKILIAVALLLGWMDVKAQKIDFDFTGRQQSEVNEEGYTSWMVSQAASESKTIDGLTFRIAATGEANVLKAQWSKSDIKSGKANLKLLGDAVVAFVLDGDNNTPISKDKRLAVSLTISGLTAGTHTIQAYHNGVNGYKNLAPIRVLVNGKEAEASVPQSANAQSISEAGCSYVTVNAESGKNVVITYQSIPQTGKNYDCSNVYINGLVIDGVNTNNLASTPYPADKDFHANADTGQIMLTWTAPKTALRHHLYFGTDSAQLRPVTILADTCYLMKGIDHKSTYYWRIDEEIDGQTYPGTVWSFRARHLAFPGAEGYGKWAIGGRGGSVYHVTTLADNGDDNNPIEGSFRYGIKKVRGPRTIVFDVSGIIHLKSRLTCSDKYVTIAGQTAPGNGIMLATCPFGMASDGQTRFLRMGLGHKKLVNGVIPGNRNGESYGDDADTSDETTLSGIDGMGMAGNNFSIMDHCSISWTIDEAFSSRSAQNVTLQRTLISEALNQAGHPNYDAGARHGFAATIGGGEMLSTLSVGSYHHNLLAHNEGRNYSISGGLDAAGYYDGHHDIFNNVVYNWGGRATDGGSHEINFVGNYYKMGPATTQKKLLRLQLEGTGKGTQSAYVSGNVRQAAGNGKITEDKKDDTYAYELSHGQKLTWEPFVSKPFFDSQATVESARQAYKNVLSDVGANQPALTNHDERMIRETLEGTTTTAGSRSGKKGLIDSETDKGCEGFSGLNITEEHRAADFDTDQDGMPDWWEKAVGSNPETADNNDDNDGDGFTNLEDYLNWMACPHFTVSSSPITIDMKKYFVGYDNQPTFKLVNDGGMVVKDQGNGIYAISANKKTTVLPSLTVTATDADNTGSYTRTFNFYYEDGATGISTISRSETPSRYEIYNLAGQKVADGRSLKGLLPGTYIVKGMTGSRTVKAYKAYTK